MRPPASAARQPMSMEIHFAGMDDEAFVRKFETAGWPADQWHHREHIKTQFIEPDLAPLPRVNGR